jgi:hypothetical protein
LLPCQPRCSSSSSSSSCTSCSSCTYCTFGSFDPARLALSGFHWRCRALGLLYCSRRIRSCKPRRL